MNHDEFVELLEERGDAVYIVDKGLVRFGKFALTLLAMFALIGAFFFGLDIKKASDEAKQARFDTEKTLSELKAQNLELAETKQKIVAANDELDHSKVAFKQFISDAKVEIKKDMDDAAETSKRTLGIEQEIVIYQLQIKQFGGARGALPTLTSAKSDQQEATALAAPGGTVHTALVSEVKEISSDDLARIARALQKQMTGDLAATWNIAATVEPYMSLDQVPKNYWPVIIKKDIGSPGAGGIHANKDGQPFAAVQYDTTLDIWTLNASHELLEMLIDPLGNRMMPAPSPDPADNGKIVNVLIEIAQPVEDPEYGYKIDGIMVSDFVTPAFYNPSPPQGSRFSFTGAAKSPLKILKGGFLSWINPDKNEWIQEIWFDGDSPRIRNIGKAN